MEQLKRGDKIYLDNNKEMGSAVNSYLEARDGIVEVYEYRGDSGYGMKTRLFLCHNTKHEHISIIRQEYLESIREWTEEVMTFDTDSFSFLVGLITDNKNILGGEYTLVRDY